MAKKQHHEEHENHERWLVSYADFITLLFAFFVVMYSTSRVDNKRLAQVVHAIQFAMHFKGMDFPATKQDLMRHAEQTNAPGEVRQMLQRLPDNQRFGSMADLMAAWGKEK